MDIEIMQKIESEYFEQEIKCCYSCDFHKILEESGDLVCTKGVMWIDVDALGICKNYEN